MKILLIVSSNRKNGNTHRLVSLLEEELKNIAQLQHEEIEVERVFLGEANLSMCLGCRICFDKGEESCPLKDDLLSIRNKINKVDGIVLASPVYVEDVNGIMKNWIDRMAFNCHRPSFYNKTALIISTSGNLSTNHAVKTMKNALTAWGAYVNGIQKFTTGALMNKEEILSRYQKRIRNTAKKFFMSIKKEKYKKPKLISLIAFKVQQKNFQRKNSDQYKTDYAYWSEKGWLKPSCTYYEDIKTNRIKLVVAKFIGNVISMFLVY